MKCMVCHTDANPYFQKRFDVHGLGDVKYERCPACAFVFSKTHMELSQSQWESLNGSYHEGYLGTGRNDDDPHWVERILRQATVLAELARMGVLKNPGTWLDFACGDGKLALVLSEMGLPVRRYDRYMSGGGGSAGRQDLKSGTFDLVLSTSYLEHIRDLEQFDEMLDLVSLKGVFAFHTEVRASVPRDPGWFYLIPVHCSFFSDESMRKIFATRGFKKCIYHSQSSLWFWFRDPKPYASGIRAVERGELGLEYYVGSNFVRATRRDRLEQFLRSQSFRAIRVVRRVLRGGS